MSQDTDEWSTEQVVANAGNWSLAGDVAILNKLKNFSQVLLLEVNLLNSKVDNLANNLELVGLKVDITKNEFHGLRNLKFIENRVYEDDETTETESDKGPTKEPTEELKENALKDALLNGFKLVDKYYDKIEVDVSDSEGESNEKGFVLQPKDPYIDRPLPYLVGSDNWVKKQHIGLVISDESESEQEQEDVYSSSDSETYLPKNKALDSETSSEVDFASRTSDPITSSSLTNAESFKRDDVHSYDEESKTSSSVSNKIPISKEQFAEQLASKLGDVITSRQTNENTISDPQSKPREKLSNYESLFSDQPPPLEDLNKSILPKPVQQSLFGDDNNLFSGNNSLLWSTTNKPTHKSSDDQKSSDTTPTFSKAVKASKGLFSDSRSSSEEDMLAVTERRKLQSSAVHANPYLPASKSTIPFLADEPPDISPKKETQPNRKIPIGGVSVFGKNTDIFGEKPVKFQLPLKEEELSTKTENSENVKSQSPIPKQSIKKISLFDDSDSSETETVKPVKSELLVKGKLSPKAEKSENISRSKTFHKTTIRKTNLFDDFSDPSEDDDITLVKPELPLADKLSPTTEFNKNVKLQSGTPKKSIKMNLFDDSSDSSDSDEIFSSKKEPMKYKLTESSSKEEHSSIFESLNEEFIPKDNPASKPSLIQKGSPPVVKKISLFDDDDEDDDDILKEEEDLFSGLSKKGADTKHQVKSENIDDLEAPNHLDDFHQKVKKSKNDNTEKCLKDSEKSPVKLATEGDIAIGLAEPKNDDLFAEQQEISVSQTGLSNSEPTLKDVKLDSGDVDNQSVEQQPNVINKMDSMDDGENEVNIQGTSDSIAHKALRGDSSPPPINLFDPTPPPVDWVALSDDSAESDKLSWTEEILDQAVTNPSQLKANIFDEAPPSLLGNQTDETSSTWLDTNLSFTHDSSLTSPLSPDSSFDLPSSCDPFPSKVESKGIPHIESLDEISVNSNVENKITLAGGDIEEGKEGSAIVKTATPGKLKHNLNINVKALLPGKMPFNNRPVVGTSDSRDQLDKSPIFSPTKDVTTSPPSRSSSVTKPKQEKISPKKELGNSSFDELGETKILHSITKNRAKVPIKRRPSRRARHGAASIATTTKEVPALNISKASSSNEESDLFTNDNLRNRRVQEATKLKDRGKAEKNNELSATKDEEKDTIFDKKDQVLIKKEIAASAGKPAPAEKMKSSALFSDKSEESDSDAGWFSRSKLKLPKTDRAKKSIFDSSGESSEDDLFGSKSSKNASHTRRDLEFSDVKMEKKSREVKTANIKKLENKQVTDFDPLSRFK